MVQQNVNNVSKVFRKNKVQCRARLMSFGSVERLSLRVKWRLQMMSDLYDRLHTLTLYSQHCYICFDRHVIVQLC